MKRNLALIFSALLLSGCGSGGGGDGSGGAVNANDNNSDESSIANADNNTTSGSETTDPFNNGPITTTQSPSGTSQSSDYTDQFITGFISTAEYEFWGCIAQRDDNKIQLLLVKSNDNKLIAQVSVNGADFVESTWLATASALTVVPDTTYSNLEFSDYSFSSETQWSSNIVNGSYSDAADCNLYDQDGKAVGSNSTGGTTQPNGSSGVEFTRENIINPIDSEGYFTNIWSCESDSDDPFVAAYADNGQMAISIDSGDFLYLDWSIDASKSTIYWEGESTYEFNGVEFQSTNAHTGYFEANSQYQCVRESL